MKPLHRTKKIIIIVFLFLLSLLFHMSSVIYVVWQKNNNSPDQSPQEKAEDLTTEMKKQEEWAETKARRSNFGAPVMFQDIPSYAEAMADRPAVAPSFAESFGGHGEAMADRPDELETKEEEPTPPEEKIIEKIIPEKVVPEEKSVAFEEPVKQKPISKPKKSAILQQAPYFAKASSDTQDERRKVTSKPMAAPKPPLSLAQLTQGFLNHVKDEGNHAIHMLGKKNGTPSDEQIKHERYLEKLGWCLQNSFNIHNDRFPRSATDATNVHVLLSLNKDGTMKLCNVAKTSGNIQLDQFTLFVFNDASSSFPPVPHYLPHDPFTVTYIIMINQREQNAFQMYRR